MLACMFVLGAAKNVLGTRDLEAAARARQAQASPFARDACAISARALGEAQTCRFTQIYPSTLPRWLMGQTGMQEVGEGTASVDSRENADHFLVLRDYSGAELSLR